MGEEKKLPTEKKKYLTTADFVGNWGLNLKNILYRYMKVVPKCGSISLQYKTRRITINIYDKFYSFILRIASSILVSSG